MLKRTWISEPKHAELQQKTANEFHGLSAMIQAGWPETKQQVPHSIWEYWESRDELAVLDGVVYRGMKIVPLSMRPAMLKLIHGSHLGIMKCKQRAREVLHWSGMSAKIEDKVKDFTAWHNYAPARQKQLLMPIFVSKLPRAMAASDIFAFEGYHYLALVDYYSKYIEVTKLNDFTSQDTTEALKQHFRRHGIPKKLVTGRGFQYTSKELEIFQKLQLWTCPSESQVPPCKRRSRSSSQKSKITLEKKHRQEQSTSRVQSHLNPRNQPVSVSTPHET